MFNPEEYAKKVTATSKFITSMLPKNFHPQVAITLGSGGLGSIKDLIDPVCDPLDYNSIPDFPHTTVVGHEGKLYAGYIANVPVLGLSGRKHFYELGGDPSLVSSLKTVVFPVYVMRMLGISLYIATNAAGGLNPSYLPGDLMVISSHLGTYFPNALLGPQVSLFNAVRFQPQHTEYNEQLRKNFTDIAVRLKYADHVHEGVYCALTGPTYETKAEILSLRGQGVDAVGMSTVPEIMTATNIGMETFGVSLITNVVGKDGTNATSHEEVMKALSDKETKHRFLELFQEFFFIYKKS